MTPYCMTPYCTSTIPIEFEGVDFAEVVGIVCTISQNGTVLEKTEDQLIVAGSTITVELAQEDTSVFSPGFAEIQFNFLFTSGERKPSNIGTLKIGRNLHMELMGEEE